MILLTTTQRSHHPTYTEVMRSRSFVVSTYKIIWGWWVWSWQGVSSSINIGKTLISLSKILMITFFLTKNEMMMMMMMHDDGDQLFHFLLGAKHCSMIYKHHWV